jgi:hypothetical protein
MRYVLREPTGTDTSLSATETYDDFGDVVAAHGEKMLVSVGPEDIWLVFRQEKYDAVGCVRLVGYVRTEEHAPKCLADMSEDGLSTITLAVIQYVEDQNRPSFPYLVEIPEPNNQLGDLTRVLDMCLKDAENTMLASDPSYNDEDWDGTWRVAHKVEKVEWGHVQVTTPCETHFFYTFPTEYAKRFGFE